VAERARGTIVAERYRLERKLGRGGMGTVFAATDLETDTPVAVKVLHGSLAEKPELLERFFQEARAAAALRDENVVEVLDTGLVGRLAYIVLELLEGESLGARLTREGRLSPAETLRLLLPVVDVLVTAHDRKILHRDLKPENVFIARAADGSETVKLLDFGLAKLLDNAVALTQQGAVLGTPGYMSPEQMRGVGELTAATDVWSLGVVLFRALAGELPFEVQENPAMMVMSILTRETPRLSTVAPDVPPRLAAAVDLALKHSPDTRHRDMRELREALLEAAEADGIAYGSADR